MTNEEAIERINILKAFTGYDKDNQMVTELHEALDMAIKALKSSIHIPSNATNGDVIKAVFGAEFIRNTLYGVVIDLDGEIELSDDWWFAPYREGDAE